MKKSLRTGLAATLALSVLSVYSLQALADVPPAKVSDFSVPAGEGTVAEAAQDGVRLTCDGQYDFGCRFLYDRAVPLDGLELQLTDMNIGTTSFQQVGQGGICLWLAADETLANAIRIPIHSNVYGNSGGGVFDTAGNTYYDAGEGPFFWSSSGGATGHSLKLDVDKTSDAEYTLTLVTEGFGKNGMEPGTATRSATVPADKMAALFADGKAKVVISAYFQPTAGAVGTSEMTLKAVTGTDAAFDAAAVRVLQGESENAKVSAPQGVRLTSSSTYNFETQFLYNKETTIDGMEIRLTDMNIGTSSFQMVGQGGISVWLTTDAARTKALQIKIDSNLYGNTGGSVLDTAGNVYHEEASGATFWGPSGGATGHSLQINVDKTSDTEYTLTLVTEGFGKKDGVPAATATKTVTVPADKMEALFASGKAKVVIASYFQPTAGVVGEANVTVASLYNEADKESDPGDNDDPNKPEKPAGPDVKAAMFKTVGSTGALADTENGVKYNADGAYDYGETAVFKHKTTLDGMQVRLVDMNLASTAVTKSGQGGFRMYFTTDGTAAGKGFVLELSFNVFGNAVLDIKTTDGKELAKSDGMFFRKVEGGVPVEDLTVAIRKDADGKHYTVSFSTESYSYFELYPEVKPMAVDYQIDAAAVDALLADGKTGFGISAYFQPKTHEVGKSSLTIYSVINPDADDDRSDSSGGSGTENPVTGAALPAGVLLLAAASAACVVFVRRRKV